MKPDIFIQGFTQGISRPHAMIERDFPLGRHARMERWARGVQAGKAVGIALRHGLFYFIVGIIMFMAWFMHNTDSHLSQCGMKHPPSFCTGRDSHTHLKIGD